MKGGLFQGASFPGVFNVMSGIVLTGKLNSIPFYPVDLAREVFLSPWEFDSSTWRREKSGVI